MRPGLFLNLDLFPLFSCWGWRMCMASFSTLIAKHKHVTCQITTKTKMAENWQKVENGQGFFAAAVNPWDRVVSADQQLDVLGEDLLNCSICFERFKRPKILPCLHTFCQLCIQRHFDIYKLLHGGRLSCPTCRELININGDISSLRYSFCC